MALTLFCRDSSKHEMPVSVCNCLLVCCHGKLLFDPWDSEQSNEISRLKISIPNDTFNNNIE